MSEAAPTPPKKPRRTRLLNAVLAGVLALLVLALVAIYLVERVPGFYLSAESRDRQKAVGDANSFCRQVQVFFGSNILSSRAEPVAITDNEVNGYLLAVNDQEIWDLLSLRFEPWRKPFTSSWLHNVQIHFSPGEVTVAGEVTWHGMAVVLSVTGETVVENGKARFHVTGIRAGSLSLPKLFFRRFINSLDDHQLPAKISHWRLTSVEVREGRAVLHGETDN